VVVIPHAVDPRLIKVIEKPSKLSYRSLDYSLPRVFLYANHSFSRKGWDISLSVLQEMCFTRHDFNVILKSWHPFGPDVIRLGCRKLLLSGHDSPDFHYQNMNQSTHFFYPARGGAFEITVLEMLAMGKTVVIPEQGAWSEIPLSRDDVYWIKVNGLKRYWFDNSHHVGEFVEPDRYDALRQFDMSLKDPIRVNMKEYQDVYSPQAIAQRLVQLVRN
jgi:glycosyltransferase involved in cell wall biosynthesis